MKNQALITIFALLFHFTQAQHTNNKPMLAEFDKLLSAQFKTNEPGAAVLVSQKGQVLYKKGFGMANIELNVPMQADNVFRIASITKQFTAMAILQLIEQGKLSLKDEITKFVPDYPTSGHKITIEHLLTHTSGLANTNDMPEYMGKMDVKPTEMIDHFKNLPMKFAPGTNWSYSNNGYFLLGYIIEKISGKTYAEYLEEHFFKPLEMTNSLYANDIKIVPNRAAAYTQGEKGYENAQLLNVTHPYAAGSIQSTVEDLLKWNQALHANKVVKKENLDKAITKYKLNDGTETAYGYGLRLGNVYESVSIWHGGLISGFKGMALYLPKEEIFVAVLTNCDCSSPETIAPKLAAIAAGKPFEFTEIALETSVMQDYVGVYENQKGLQKIITVSEGRLYAQSGRGPKAIARAYQKDLFFFKDGSMSTLKFTRNKKEQVTELITQTLKGNEVWSKTNKPMPSENGIQVAENILETYVGEYEMGPEFAFIVSKEQAKLFLKTPGQEKLELFAETESKFFLKVNDAQLEFVKDNKGKVIKVIMHQGGKQTEAKKIK